LRFKIPVLGLGLWALLALGSWALDSVRFLVFPLENVSKPSPVDWLGEGVADSLSDQLRIPGVEVDGHDERSRAIEEVDLPTHAALSRASMIRVAQRRKVDHLIMGSFSGPADNVRLALRDLDMRTMKLSGEIVATGPLSALPQMENELAWIILTNDGLTQAYSRSTFQKRTRSVPNAAYSVYARALKSEEDERVKLLLKAVELHSEFPEARFLLGLYFYRNGEWVKCVQHLVKARKREESYLQTEFMLGTCYLRQNALQEAMQAYGHILAVAKPVEVLNNLAVAYLRAGDLPLAVQNIIEARNLSKSNLTVALNLSIIRHLQRNDAAALEVLEETAKAYPSNGMVQYLMGVVLRSSGEPDRATTALETARRLGTDAMKLDAEDPKSWARILPVWAPHE